MVSAPELLCRGAVRASFAIEYCSIVLHAPLRGAFRFGIRTMGCARKLADLWLRSLPPPVARLTPPVPMQIQKGDVVKRQEPRGPQAVSPGWGVAQSPGRSEAGVDLYKAQEQSMRDKRGP